MNGVTYTNNGSYMLGSVFKHVLDTTGDGTGTTNAVGNYTGGGTGTTEFKFTPDTTIFGAVSYKVTTLVITLSWINNGGGSREEISPLVYGNNAASALANGYRPQIDFADGTVYPFAATLITMNSDILALPEVTVGYANMGGSNHGTFMTAVWPLKQPLILSPDNQEALTISLSDDFSGLHSQFFTIYGEK